MKRKESQQLYTDIYNLCLKHPEYKSNKHISEFLGRLLRSKYQDTLKDVELSTLTKMVFLITSADRIYRKVRENEFKLFQDKTKQQIEEEETMLALDYIPWHDTDINKLETL